jgi:hypothetical protein
MSNAPDHPGRISLQDHIRSFDNSPEQFALSNGYFPCANCEKSLPAYGLTDVRDISHIPHDFVCGHCIIDAHRHALAITQSLAEAFAPADWRGVTKAKRALLGASLWATATDGTVDPDLAVKMLAWRQTVSKIGPATHARPSLVVFPPDPSEDEIA